MLLALGHDADGQLACYLAALGSRRSIRADGRTPNLTVQMALVATTLEYKLVLALSWINRLASEIVVGIRQGSG